MCGREEKDMENSKWIRRVTSGLLMLSTVFATSMGCHVVWGDVEVPECLRKEAESQEHVINKF